MATFSFRSEASDKTAVEMASGRAFHRSAKSNRSHGRQEKGFLILCKTEKFKNLFSAWISFCQKLSTSVFTWKRVMKIILYHVRTVVDNPSKTVKKQCFFDPFQMWMYQKTVRHFYHTLYIAGLLFPMSEPIMEISKEEQCHADKH